MTKQMNKKLTPLNEAKDRTIGKRGTAARDRFEQKKTKWLAARWIKEMQAAGMTPDEMIKVIGLAREKFQAMKGTETSIKS